MHILFNRIILYFCDVYAFVNADLYSNNIYMTLLTTIVELIIMNNIK